MALCDKSQPQRGKGGGYQVPPDRVGGGRYNFTRYQQALNPLISCPYIPLKTATTAGRDTHLRPRWRTHVRRSLLNPVVVQRPKNRWMDPNSSGGSLSQKNKRT